MKKQPRFIPAFSLKTIGWYLFFLCLILITFLAGYFVGFDQAEEELVKERNQTRQLVKQIEQIVAIDKKISDEKLQTEKDGEVERERLKQELQTFLEEEDRKRLSKPQHEYAPDEPEALPPPAAKRPETYKGTMGKLVIIIDDVSYERDVKMIQSTGLPLVMSFLPPSPRHPESAALAAGHTNAMLHLPLEAVHFSDEEPFTLRIGDSEEVIQRRIDTLIEQFPNVRYWNNHTGSKYTADRESMDKLIRVLKKEGIQFVDSRTIGKTKVPESAREHGMRYIGRDVFLDHKDGVNNVKHQIKEAVEKAKRHGTAVAIGHPRPDTIQALKESKEILRQVKLVGIEEI